MGGSMPLPRISGFSEAFFLSDHKPPPDVEHIMSGILGNNRFQRGNRAARSYANLVVLFRMVLFYGPLKHDARFWGWVTEDWGIVKKDTRDMVSRIANFYSDARYAALGATEHRISLLVRLVDEWLLIRPRPELRHSAEVNEATVTSLRTAWLNIRDWHVDMLMDGKLPACLTDVEPPAKKVTSLWETDPEVVALLREINPKRKSETLVNKARMPKLPGEWAEPANSSVDRSSMERKRKASSSAGEADESEPMLTSDDSVFDESRFTLRPENEHGGLTTFMLADHVPKRNHLPGDDDSSEYHFPPETAVTFDMIEFPDAGHASLPVRPPPSSKSAPTLIQSKLTQYANHRAAATTAATTGTDQQQEQNVQLHSIMRQSWRRRDELTVRLRRMASQTRRRREELRTQVETETAACVPRSSAIGVENGLMASEERQLYETRLRGVEARLTALERAQRDDANWARTMAQSLNDANEKSVHALQEVLVAIETLQRTTSILLEDSEKREE